MTHKAIYFSPNQRTKFGERKISIAVNADCQVIEFNYNLFKIGYYLEN